MSRAFESALKDTPHESRPIPELEDWLGAPMLDTDLLIIGPEVADPIQVAQRVHLKESGFDIVMMLRAGERSASQAQAELAPYLTRRDICHDADDLADLDWFRVHVGHTLARRKSQAALTRARQEMAAEKERSSFDDVML